MRARRSSTGLLAASLVLPIAAMLSDAPPAAAAEPVVEVGWWTRSPSQSAPEGGFAVAAGPDGPATVAAIRVTSSGLSSVSVVAVETGGLNQGLAAVQACTTTVTWAPTAAGELAEAPEADCEAGSVDFTRDAGAMRWAGDLTPLIRDGALSVVLVPGEASGAAVIGFDVQFAVPQVAATSGEPETPSEEPGTGGGTTSDEAGTGSTGSGSAGSGGATGSFGGDTTSFTPLRTDASATPSSGFGSSVGSSFTASPPPAAPVPAGSAPQPLAESSGDEVALAPTAAGEGAAATAFTPLSGGSEPAEPRWGQALFFVVLSVLAAVVTAGGNRLRRQRAAAA